MRDAARVPVIVGVAQITDVASPPDRARSPLELLVEVAKAAAEDSGAGERLIRAIDSLAVIRFFADTSARFASPFGRPVNPPWSVARRLGIMPPERIYTPGGGNMPQVMVSRACERIARGESKVALIAGAEALRTQLAATRAGLALDWSEDAPEAPEELGGHPAAFSEHEAAHGVRAAIHAYPLFEQAIRGARRASPEQHRASMGRLLARFAAVARDNPLATRRRGYTAEEIVTPSPENPLIGLPYTKLMNANAFIDQAAALLVCSAELADQLGVPLEKRVHLHGCAQGNDHWFISERVNLHSSPAIRGVVGRTLDMAGRRLDEIDLFDLYSCFGSAVEIGAREIGLAEDDPRGLTVTGGLPYFGGPGNNYVTHAICEMAQRLRARPGSFGLVTANGNYVTKHAAGLYSTTPPDRPWEREEPSVLQRALDALPKAPFTQTPEGPAVIETYTVLHNRGGPERAIVFGRLSDTDVRFIANPPDDAATLADLGARDCLGRPGIVRRENGRNLFVPS